MKRNLEKGRLGENIASAYLKARGYRILETNYRHRRSEIDIIALHQAVLVFVEVKTRTSLQYGYPEAAVDNHKIEMITAVADHYIDRISWDKGIRFDIIAILLREPPEIEHLQDAF